MQRSYLAALVAALFAIPLMALPTAASDPTAEFVAAAEAAGLTCLQADSGGDQRYCDAPYSDDRLWSAHVDPIEEASLDFHASVIRHVSLGASPPAEADVYGLMVDFVSLAYDGDDETTALDWLAEMNAGPQESGTLELGYWALSWSVLNAGTGEFEGVALNFNRFTEPFEESQPGWPPAVFGGELEGYAQSYGLECSGSGTRTDCTREVLDAGAGSVYSMTLTYDDGGELVTIDAAVTSRDASMPSDAFGFLRGVAERAAVSDAAELLAWLDGAVGDQSPPTYESGEWFGEWVERSDAAGTVWALTLLRDDDGPTAAPTEDAVPQPSASPGAQVPGGTGNEAPGAPMAGEPFADAVPTVGEISTDPIVLLQSAILAALLVFLMPFPSQLFNSTLEAHEDEVRRWFRLDRLGTAAAGIGAFWASWPGVAVFTLLAALLYGFLDPGFGIGLGSLATFTGMLLGIALVTAAFAIPAVLAHRRIGSTWTLKVVPLSLLIGVACVLLSRVTGFQPGYLYGLLIGLAFARELSAADEGRATAVGAVTMLGAALVAWLALGALPAGDAFGLVVARTTLAALMVAGLEGVVFGLLPMRFLPGEPLYAWNRVAWGALLAVGAFAFFHILINPASGYLSDTSRTPLVTVVALLVGFSLVSVAFWGLFRFRHAGPAETPTEA